jgi:soluble lytic murein transglycosylase-like protein
MAALLLATLVIGGIALMQRKPTNIDSAMRLVIDAARAANVPVHVALAFADLESAFNSRAEGDLDWHSRSNGALYKKHVLGNPTLANNPALNDPAAWHSYGLFQLLAPYHVKPTEHPQELLDAKVNAQRGVAFIAKLLKQNQGDVVRARLAYVGCLPDGSRCNPAQVELYTTRLQRALAKWMGAELNG